MINITQSIKQFTIGYQYSHTENFRHHRSTKEPETGKMNIINLNNGAIS